jgi:hypothetical protein
MSDGNLFHTPNSDGDAPLISRVLALPSFLWRYFYGAYGELLYEQNWLKVGDMSPSDVVEILQDAFDDMSEPEVGGMQFITGSSFNLINEVNVSGIRTLVITPSILPSEAAIATALFLVIGVTYHDQSAYTWVTNGAIGARQLLYSAVGETGTFTTFAPMVNGQARIRTNNAAPNTVTWSVDLIGWL